MDTNLLQEKWKLLNWLLPEDEQIDYPSYLELRNKLRIPLYIIDRAFDDNNNKDGRNN